MLRGEVWWGVWPNDPLKKKRPLLVVSNDFRNQSANIPDVVVVKVTSLHRSDKSEKPTNPAEDLVVQFKKPSIIRCGSIFTVEKQFLLSKADQISSRDLVQIGELLKNALDLF